MSVFVLSRGAGGLCLGLAAVAGGRGSSSAPSFSGRENASRLSPSGTSALLRPPAP